MALGVIGSWNLGSLTAGSCVTTVDGTYVATIFESDKEGSCVASLSLGDVKMVLVTCCIFSSKGIGSCGAIP